MANLNPNYGALEPVGLFPEVRRRTEEFRADHPGADPYRLGIGDTTLPLTPVVVDALREAAEAQGDAATYRGYGARYGAEFGTPGLREAIAAHYGRRGVAVDPEDIFVSDGAKPDLANIQSIFAPGSVVAVQDPAYPIYVDTAVVSGKAAGYEDGRYAGIVYMDSTEEDGFCPQLPEEDADLIYLCNPNNPTGTAATREQLEAFVSYAHENDAVIIYDAAYSAFISDDGLPRSIYEIEGAENCAVEVSSFSKLAGFTGLRLGWTVVPKQLAVGDAEPGEARRLWARRQVMMFNGASNLAQAGGLAVLSEQGLAESQHNIDYYMRNAATIRAGLGRLGIRTFGGEHAPYVWAKGPDGMGSWAFFDKLLQEAHVVGTPGLGYGRRGEGFVRLSAFGSLEDTEAAIQSIEASLRV